MDIAVASRGAANLNVTAPVQVTGIPAVAGNNDASADPLVSRATAEPESTARTGDGDNTELRSRRPASVGEFTPEELAELQDLRARDREVRAHELAHLAAAGRHARGGASFTFESGPDGRRYAVAGEVSIDTSEVPGDPAATLAKAQQVRRAALAPANPSAQDRQIAAQAAAMAAQATAELAQQRDDNPNEAARVESTPGVKRSYTPAADADPLIELIA